MREAADIDATGSYDAFTLQTLLQLKDYGFCKKGARGQCVSDGTMRLGGRCPNNTSGGHLCEGYAHGLNMVVENVRQIRGEVDDSRDLSMPLEIDEQRGQRGEHDARRVVGNLVTSDRALAPPDLVRRAGIGSRVRMVYCKAGDGLAIPNWTLDEGAEQPDNPWRYPQE